MVSLLLGLAVATAPQDTLHLGPGVHPGPLVIDRPTVVLGAPGAVLRGPGRGSVVVVRAPGSVIRGVTIEGSGADLDADDAGVMVRADSVTLEDLVLRDVLHGVYVRDARDVALRRLVIVGRPGLPESETGNGIHLWSSRRIVVTGAHISQVRDGMFLEYADSVDVTDSRVERVRFGLHYMFSHHNRFARNVFTDNQAGAVIMNSRGVEVTDNVFAWNAGSRSYGLVLQTATAPLARGNLVVGNGIGVFFDNVLRGTFTGNVVAGNWLGLELFTNSEGTRITDNAILGNTFDASGGGMAGAYTLCQDGRGNYWGAAAADGYDLDGDGVLDQPHHASSPLAELARRRSGLRFFLGSPAARALEWAERTFPVFHVVAVEDTCPLVAPPEPAMLARMPGGPGGTERGGGRQGAAGAVVLAGGVLAFAAARRGRRR
jgi:nitrous oxidase accessory protein